MSMGLKAFVFAFATLLVVPLHGMSYEGDAVNNSGEKTPEPGPGIQPPFSSPLVLSMGGTSAQASFVKQSAQAGATVFSNTDKQFVKQAAQGMQQEPDSLLDSLDSRGSSPEFQGSYSSLQLSNSHAALSTHVSASASHLASRSGNNFSAPVSPIPLVLTETDVQPVVTVTEQIETKTAQRNIVSLASTYGTSDDEISRLLQENYQRIATYNPYHAWILAQVTDFCVEGRSVVQVYLDARYDDQKDAIIQTIESMNPGLSQRYSATTENPVVDREGKTAAADISINDTTSDGTTTTSTGSLSTTQPASAITTQSCATQGSASAHDWTSQVFVAHAVERGTNTAHVTTSTGATTTHSTASADISDDNSDDNDESGVSRSCVITSRPGADTH